MCVGKLFVSSIATAVKYCVLFSLILNYAQDNWNVTTWFYVFKLYIQGVHEIVGYISEIVLGHQHK